MISHSGVQSMGEFVDGQPLLNKEVSGLAGFDQVLPDFRVAPGIRQMVIKIATQRFVYAVAEWSENCSTKLELRPNLAEPPTGWISKEQVLRISDPCRARDFLCGFCFVLVSFWYYAIAKWGSNHMKPTINQLPSGGGG